jgi:hypothetical protein
MKIESSIIVIISGIFAFALALLLIQYFVKELRKKADTSDKLNLSFGLWFGSLLLSISLLLSKALSVMNDAIVVLLSFSKEGMYIEIIKSGSIFIGLAFIWFVVSFFIIKIFFRLIFSSSIDVIEMEQNNSTYFLIKGIMFIAFILVLLPIFETLLRGFILSVDTPIYH